ncbi:ferredoxin reductase domain-containing protein [Celerinatantimonas yamalensis]|uniref:FAD-binding 8 domain-containing protein n=1 Tax=Celerinatantimonas yamalensis TaxID=559956 RepID=A0ABW9G966_9GAMM
MLSINKGVFEHLPGQFAFVRFAHDKEPHPFSIMSASPEGKSLHFAIKSLGDYTSVLAAHDRAGRRS